MDKPLNDKQLKAIELLVEGQLNVRQICKEVPCSPSTFYEWMKKSEFKNKIDEMMEYKNELMKDMLKARVEEYIETLETIRKKSKNDMARYHSTNVLLAHAGWNSNKQEITVNNKDEDEEKNKLLSIIKSKENEQQEKTVH